MCLCVHAVNGLWPVLYDELSCRPLLVMYRMLTVVGPTPRGKSTTLASLAFGWQGLHIDSHVNHCAFMSCPCMSRCCGKAEMRK